MSAVSGNCPTFSFPVRVYYEDTDAAGVVYYANYLKFFERARTEWLRMLGLNQTELAAESGVVFVVRSANLQYRKPARLDDALTIRSQITRLGRASIEFSQWCELNDDVLTSARIQIGCVEKTRLHPIAMPDRVRICLQPLAAPRNNHSGVAANADADAAAIGSSTGNVRHKFPREADS